MGAPDDPIPVIFNPSARSERSRQLLSRLPMLHPRAEVILSEGPGHARELAAGFAEQGAPKIVAAGGDGTINEVVNGLHDGGLERGTRLGLLPAGTMNVFATELGIPSTAHLERCWEIIAGGNVRDVDLWTANGHCFVQLAGVGLDAEVIKETTWDRKKAFGPLSYLMSAASVLGRSAPTVVVRREDGREVRGAIVLIGNGQRYGGPFRIFREATNCDGLLDVIVLRDQGLHELISFLKAASLTGYGDTDGVTYFQARELTVESTAAPDGTDAQVSVEADGDLIGTTPVRFRRANQPLRVLAPSDAPA